MVGVIFIRFFRVQFAVLQSELVAFGVFIVIIIQQSPTDPMRLLLLPLGMGLRFWRVGVDRPVRGLPWRPEAVLPGLHMRPADLAGPIHWTTGHAEVLLA